MRKSLHELNQIPPEFGEDGAKEFAPVPDEFNRDWQPKKRTEEKPSLIRKVMLYLAASGLVTLGVITPIVRTNDAEQAAAVPTPAPSEVVEVTETPRATPEPTLRPTAAPTPEPTEVPTPEPTPTPPLTGQIHITVYSDILDWSNFYPSEVLVDETLDAATFTSYALPPLPEQDGYTAYGYVLLSYHGLAYFDTLYFDNEEPHLIGSVALHDNTLDAEDLAIVPQSIDDIYEANIYVVWLADGGNFHLAFYDEDLFGEYYVGFPLYSEGMVYLAPFPTPERDGKTFAGWCDKDGHMIDAVTYFDFFPVVPPAESMEDRDWKNPIPCKVYACWSDGSGGAPGATPAPTAAPAPTSSSISTTGVAAPYIATPAPKTPTPKPTATVKPTPTPSPTPIPPYYSIQCKSCSFSCDFGSGTSGSIPKGASVTVFAISESSSVGWFSASPSSAGKGSSSSPLSGVALGSGRYYFVYTFTMSADTDIVFMTP